MTNYINTTTLQYPVTERDIRQNNPNVSYPSPFNPGEEYAVVFPSPQPLYNPVLEYVQEGAPVFTDKGNYEQTWVVVQKYNTEEERNEAIASDLASKRAQKWEQIKAERDKRTQNGGYLAVEKWFHSDTFSRSQQIGLVLMGSNIPEGLMWKTMDGSFIEMTQAVANAVFVSAGTQDSATFAYAESLKAQVDASSDPLSIDIYSGWPVCFLDIE